MINIDIQVEQLDFGARLTSYSPFSFADLRSRSPFSITLLEHLQGSRVAIFGAGSGGSKIALDLARAGVGQLQLIDPSLLQIHNLSRHLGTLADIGRPKAEVVAEQVVTRIPSVTVEYYPLDLFAPDPPLCAANLLKGANLIIGATDRVAVQLAINECAWQLGIPAVFGGCYESARGGEVFFTLPGTGTPCLSCLRSGVEQPHGAFDYSSASSFTEYEGEPGLSSAVDLITDVETQVALAVLLRKTDASIAFLANPKLCFILVGGAQANGYYRFRRPFDIFWQPLSGPRPGCPICQIAEEGDLVQPELSANIPDDFKQFLE